MAINIPYASGGGSIYLQPKPPTPLKDDGFISTNDETIAHKGTLVDNIEFPEFGAGNPIVGKLADVTVWTVSPSNINAATNRYYGSGTCCWYDSVNDRLYVFASDSATTPRTLYTAYITVETGAVTNIGSVQLTTDPLSADDRGTALCQRSSIDSGNFTLQFRDRTIVINESTGAEVSNVAALDTGNVGGYSTLDGSVYIVSFNSDSTSIQQEKPHNKIYTPY